MVFDYVPDGAKLYLEQKMRLSNVTLATAHTPTDFDAEWLPTSYLEPHWYAIYSCANRERRVACEMATRGIENFLPVYHSLRRWRDRRVNLELPLFPGYVFARLALREKLRVLQIGGVAHLVSFNGQPAALPDDQIETLRNALSREARVEPHPFLQAGRRVRIASGPFAGFEGILKRRKSQLRVVVSLKLIQRSIAAEVDSADIEPVR